MVTGSRLADQRAARDSGWCILRTNGRSTLRLAKSLSDHKIEAWTPATIQKRRRSRIHLGLREVDIPMMPSFVFVRARHLIDLLGIKASLSSPHPSFSIFQHAGRAPVISDRDVLHLQEAEERGLRDRRKLRKHHVAVGAEVRPTEGAFAGLVGVVEEVRGKLAVVSFGGNMRFNVATWLLVEDQLQAA